LAFCDGLIDFAVNTSISLAVRTSASDCLENRLQNDL